MTRGSSFSFDEKPQGEIERKKANPGSSSAWFLLGPLGTNILWALGVNRTNRPGFLLGGGVQENLGGTVRPGCPGTAPSLQF